MNKTGFKKMIWMSLLSLVIILSSHLWGTAHAHFQMIIPSDDMISQGESREVGLDVRFTHPFEGHGMNMERPVQFGVLKGGKKIDLLDILKAVKIKDQTGKDFTAFQGKYKVAGPGDLIFYVEPRPYWEPEEETFIVHYTKVIVNAFGMEEGWDDEVGLKTEIIPLTRPYGLWAGNVFQGIVKLNGKAVPFAEVEVEYFNDEARVKAPADPMITQVVKADANGVFTYAMPKAGWWGFAALNQDDKKMIHEGREYPVEIGALLWVKTYNMK